MSAMGQIAVNTADVAHELLSSPVSSPILGLTRWRAFPPAGARFPNACRTANVLGSHNSIAL